MVLKRPQSRLLHKSKEKAAKEKAFHNKVRGVLHAHRVRTPSSHDRVITLVKVNCCSQLLHGIQAEVNLLPGGNEGVRVPDSIGMLRQGSVYMVDCRFDDYSEEHMWESTFDLTGGNSFQR